MKKLLLTGLALVATGVHIYADEAAIPTKCISYIGILQFPDLKPSDPIPSLTAYYKGDQIDCKEGTYILTDTKKHTHFSIVIAHLEKPTANTIAQFIVPRDAPYLHYVLTRTPLEHQDQDLFKETWKVDKKEGNGPWAVPEDAFIILLDPTCIEKLTPLTWSKEGISLHLPTIVFKKGAQTAEAYNRSLFASLDLKPFHKKNDLITNKQNAKSTSSFRKL